MEPSGAAPAPIMGVPAHELTIPAAASFDVSPLPRFQSLKSSSSRRHCVSCCTLRRLMLLGSIADDMASLFETVKRSARIDACRAVISENQLPVYVCSRLEAPSHENWPALRNFE